MKVHAPRPPARAIPTSRRQGAGMTATLLQRWWRCLAGTALALICAAALSAPLTLDLPAQDLAASLRAIAQRAGLSLQIDAAASLRRPAPPLAGTFELNEALARLLAGTDLQATVDAGALIVSVRSPMTIERVTVLGQRPGIDVADRVQRAQASEIRDLFAGEASADIGGGTRNGQRLYLRGVESSQLNVTIDGARQGANLYNHRGGLFNVDPEIVRRIDVNPGPPAADDGYGALGGSVRFETIDAQDRLREGQRFGALAKVGLASVNDARRASAGIFALAADGLGMLAYGSGNDFDDLRIGGGDRVPYSGGRDRAALLRLSALQIGAHSLRLGFEQHRARGFNYMQRGDYPYQVQPPFATRPPQDQTLLRNAVTLRYDFAPGHPWINLRLTGASSRNDFNAPNSNAERFISRVRNADLRNDLRFDLGGGTGRLTFGADYFEDRGSSAFLNRPTTFTGTDNRGLFAQARIGLAAMGFEAGVRYDRWNTDFSARSASGSETSANARGEADLGAGVTLFAGVGESARGYSTIPLQFTRNIVPNLTFNGAADGTLNSETARLAEAGIRWRGAIPWLPASRGGAEAKLYDTRIADSILYRQPGSGGLGGRPVTDFFNFDRTVRFSGVEARADLGGPAWATTVSLLKPRVENLPPDPQFIARFGAPTGGKLVWDSRWQALPSLLAGYTLTAVRGIRDVPANQIVFIPRGGYALHDVQVVWRPSWAVAGDVSVAFAVNNLSDKRYSSQVTFTERGFATEEPGRNLRLTVAWAI
jgi:hemoglobin/transferrin/lactoferrin receptor protein